ncbi:MAG: hypothetical protein NVS1B7_8060 [Candidatus Saccharimonadales bacterium]
MIVLTIRTDRPEAEIGLYQADQQLDYVTWPAHRQLAETLHQKIYELLVSQKLEWSGIEGIIMYQGPGSFTGLRIGISLANTLGYSLHIPIVGTMTDNWINLGHEQLRNNQNHNIVVPEYGSAVHITLPKK